MSRGRARTAPVNRAHGAAGPDRNAGPGAGRRVGIARRFSVGVPSASRRRTESVATGIRIPRAKGERAGTEMAR